MKNPIMEFKTDEDFDKWNIDKKYTLELLKDDKPFIIKIENNYYYIRKKCCRYL